MINFNGIKSASRIEINSKFEKLPFKGLFATSSIINITFIVLGIFSTVILPPEIPLFYGLPKTEEQLAPSLFIILPSSISLFITLVNAFISVNIDSQYIKKALAFASIGVTILSLIATYKIVFLVGTL